MGSPPCTACEPCPLCGAARSCPAWDAEGFRYVRCERCHAARLDPLPTIEDQRQRFGRPYFEGGERDGYVDYEADEALHRRNALDRLGVLARERPGEPGAVLDVGCATGYFLDEARKAGWSVAGVEVSAWARAEACGRFGLEVHPTLASALASGAGRFDAVTFFQVLEHMADPLSALRNARALLKPHGVLVVETWDGASVVARLCGRYWQQINPPSVVYLFDRDSLERLARQAGFGCTRSRGASKCVRLELALHVLAAKLPGPLAPLARAAARTRLGRVEICYRLGDLMTFVAIPVPITGCGAGAPPAGTTPSPIRAARGRGT